MSTVALVIGWVVMTAGGLAILVGVLSYCWDKFVLATKMGEAFWRVFVQLHNERAFSWQRKSRKVAPLIIAFAMSANVGCAAQNEPRVYLNGRVSISSRREAEIAHRYFALGGIIGGIAATIATAALAAAWSKQSASEEGEL